tara:strand:+ start:271 stop:1254 length:984 start_codon:yes stop_codon:yes gene_type:complete
MKKLKLLDTFAGIGGFSYAAEKLVGGFETTQFIEIDPYCQKVLKKHFPNTPIHDDIRTFTARPFQYDVITGGFPCQDLSVAGRRAGITKESRSGLFYELMRVIRMVRPKYVVLENVAAILNNGLGIVLGELSQAGYNAEWAVISASSLGACHQRSRWWLVAYPKSIGRRGGNSKGCSIQERSILQNKQERRTMECEIKRRSHSTPNTNKNGSFVSEKPTGSQKYDGGSKERKEISVKSKGGNQPRNTRTFQQTQKWRNTKHLLNPNWREYVSEPTICRGNDGFSTKLDFRLRNERLKQLGNSVVPQVAAIPLQRVKDLYEQLTTVDH